MDRAEVMQVLRDKAVELLGLDPQDVQEDRSFSGDLDVDSLSLVEYTMDLEDALGIELDEDDLGRAATIGDLLDLVQRELDTALNRDG